MNYELIKTADELRRAIETIATQPVVGLDTETTKLDPFTSRLRLIQLATPDGVFIVDFDHFANGNTTQSEALAPLRRLLAALRDFETEQFVFSSTLLVHAPSPAKGARIDEESPLDPAWARNTRVLDGDRALVPRAHGRRVQHHELPEAGPLTRGRTGEAVHDRRGRGARARRVVVTRGDDVDQVHQATCYW